MCHIIQICRLTIDSHLYAKSSGDTWIMSNLQLLWWFRLTPAIDSDGELIELRINPRRNYYCRLQCQLQLIHRHFESNSNNPQIACATIRDVLVSPPGTGPKQQWRWHQGAACANTNCIVMSTDKTVHDTSDDPEEWNRSWSAIKMAPNLFGNSLLVTAEGTIAAPSVDDPTSKSQISSTLSSAKGSEATEEGKKVVSSWMHFLISRIN